MAQHRTAMGKTLDMDKLRAKNEHVRAVGNMNVNARGDTLDSHNNVIDDSSKRVNKMYQNTMINAGTLPRRVDVPQKVQQQVPPPAPPIKKLQPDTVTHSEPIISTPPAITQEPEFLEEELELDFGDDEEPVGKPVVEKKPEPKKKK